MQEFGAYTPRPRLLCAGEILRLAFVRSLRMTQKRENFLFFENSAQPRRAVVLARAKRALACSMSSQIFDLLFFEIQIDRADATLNVYVITTVKIRDTPKCSRILYSER